MNTNISALQNLVNALEKRDYITNVSPISKDGKVVGYTISFAYSDTITIYHGEDGEDGEDGQNGTDGIDGYTPQIGVMKDTDGVYYWTLDGEWMLDNNGNKIKAVGSDGADGKDGIDGDDGKDGEDGKDGSNGITPRLKIDNDYWYVSYDNGTTWQQLGKATGEDGENGVDGETLIETINIGDNAVTFILTNGQVITIPLGDNRENNKIYYTTIDGKKLFPYSTEPNIWGAILVSNTYENGQGVMTFDDTITSIGDSAFFSCSNLENITLPNCVTAIGACAFTSCSSLENITIPDSVTDIGDSAFSSCSNLENITIPNSVTEIGDSVFSGCSSLTNITIPDSVTEIGHAAFYYCSSLENITIPNSVTAIGPYAFASCSSLENITIPESVIYIGGEIFNECSTLENIYCKPTTPPTITCCGNIEHLIIIYDLAIWTCNIFNYNNNTALKGKIYVPTESEDNYKTTSKWSKYAYCIEGYDF